MGRQKLLAYPFIDEIQYREKIDPYKLNLILRSIEESVLRAILRGSELTDLYNRLNLAVETSYISLSKHVGTLFSYDSVASGLAYATAYDSVNVNGGGNQDRVAGIVTLSWDKERRYSKVPRFDTDDDNIPDTVSPAVVVSVNGTNRAQDDPAYNMLNRRNDSFWIEQAVSGVYEVEVSLPPSVNKNFNYIEIAPFPVFGINLQKVEYKDERSVWNTIYNVDTEDYKFYNNSGPLVMHLTPRTTNGIFKITCEVIDGINALGFSNMDFGLIDYNDEVQTVYMRFENAPETTITLLSSSLDFYIDDITGTQNPNKFISELSITNSLTGAGTTITLNEISSDEYQFGGETIDASNGLWLKIVMREVNRTTPVIRGCKLDYEE